MKKTILVVEDSRVQAVLLKRLLEDHGFRVLLANDGEIGLETTRQERPDLVISDVKMPKMDGFQLCRAIKSDPDIRAVPVLMLTELSDPRDIVRGLKAGADNYLTKPYEDDHLFYKVSRLLENPAPDLGLEKELVVTFQGEPHTIHTGPHRVLNLLLSTYESAVQKNRELQQTQEVLKELNERLEGMAFFDPLTALPNRRLFFDRLDQAVRHAERYNERFALMALDLDRFKQINDTLGHDAGDTLLIQVSQRLQDCLRSSDTTSRFGGDEFLILLAKVDDDRDALSAAGKIIDAIARPFRVSGALCEIGVSIGLAFFPDHATTRDLLLKRADEALYAAKNGGRNRYHISGTA